MKFFIKDRKHCMQCPLNNNCDLMTIKEFFIFCGLILLFLIVGLCIKGILI